MDFGRKQLEKYGWTDGKGLGKKEDGISKAIRPKLKFDNHGVGFDVGEQYKNNWWEVMYNKAASTISGSSEQGTSKQSTSNKGKCETVVKYCGSVKTSRLTESGTEDLDMKTEDSLEASENIFAKVLTDEELFLACGGRTAHKGARHGLKQSGKLSRIEKQEKMLLRKLKNVSLSDDEHALKKKIRKLSTHKETTNCHKSKDKEEDELDSQGSCSSGTSRKKKKKKLQTRVSFNDLVTEYYSPEPDSSSTTEESPPLIVEAKIRDDNDNEVVQVQEQDNAQDEGIEQDFEDHNDNSVVKDTFLEKLSKKERRLLKKKRKVEGKLGATAVFLEENRSEYDCPTGKCKKRKMKNEGQKLDAKKFHSDIDVLERLAMSFLDRVKAEKRRSEKARKNKKKKADKKQARQINSIAESMSQVCKISDAEDQ